MDSICSILSVFLIAYSTHASNGIHNVGKHLFIAELGDITFQRAPDVCRNRTHSIVASLDDDDIGILVNGSRNDTSDTERESKFMWIKDAQNISSLGHGCGTNRCRHGGMCIVNDSTEICLCEKGYIGKFCQYNNCLIRPCENNGTCDDNGKGYQCKCPDHYHGQWCQIQGCTPGRCSEQGSCKFVNGNVNCSCKYPYFGRFCELNNETDLIYVGCYKNNRDRILDHANFVNIGTNTPYLCAKQCALIGKRYMGLEAGTECFCGNSLRFITKANEKECNRTCVGDRLLKCGGRWRSSIYEINGPYFAQEKSWQGCRFHEDDDCFLNNSAIYESHWQKEYDEAEEHNAGYIEIRNQTGPQLIRGEYSFAVTVREPKCLRFRYEVQIGCSLQVTQQVDDSGEGDPLEEFPPNIKTSGWEVNSFQLTLSIFSTIVFLANTQSNRSVRINNFGVHDGYCECSKISMKNCIPGKLCYESMRKTCCEAPNVCKDEVKSLLLPNGKLQCTFKKKIPCFVTVRSGSWNAENDTVKPGWKLSSMGNLSDTTGILESVQLPSYSLQCLTINFQRTPEALVDVFLEDENENVSVVLMDGLWLLEKYTQAQIEIFTMENSKIQIKGTLPLNFSSHIIIRGITLEERNCTNSMCNSLFVRDTGNVTQVLPYRLNYCQWSVRVGDGNGIEFTIVDNVTKKGCDETYWQVHGVQDGRNLTSCRFTIQHNFATVKFVKNLTETVNITLKWRKVVTYCPALYRNNDEVFSINISCNEMLKSVACQEIPETTTQQELTKINAKPNTQANEDIPLPILAICIPVIFVIVIVIAILAVVIVMKRRRIKYQKETESQDVIYVNESRSIPLERKYDIDDQYSETLPNEENPYSNASDTEEQGEPVNKPQRCMDDNEEYDHLAFDGTKKNVEQNSSKTVDTETDNSYGTLHGNRVGEDQQDVYDLAESSHTKTLDMTSAEYATSSKVRGIRYGGDEYSTPDKVWGIRDGGDEYSTPDKVRGIKTVSAEYSTPEKVRGISNGGFVRDNADNTKFYSTDDVTDNTYDHAT